MIDLKKGAKIALITVLFTFLVGILCISLWFFIIERKEHAKENSVEQYRYFEKDYLTNETSLGIVTLSNEIEAFVSYDDYKLQKQFLISSFGTEEYECYGSCYCEDSKSRRFSHNPVLIKGVSYLLAAVSSIVALKIANEYYTEKCEEQYSNICESQFIRSEVEYCQEIMNNNNIVMMEGENDIEQREYFCYGNCVARKYPQSREQRPINTIDCNKLKQEGEVVVFSNDLPIKTKDQHISRKMRQTARIRFQRDHLKEFCREQSKVEYMYNWESHYTSKKTGEEKKYVHDVKKQGYLCAGVNDFQTTGTSSLKNVKCRQIQPMPNSRNNAWREKIWWEEKKKWDEI